jgi:hypothetical protein
MWFHHETIASQRRNHPQHGALDSRGNLGSCSNRGCVNFFPAAIACAYDPSNRQCGTRTCVIPYLPRHESQQAKILESAVWALERHKTEHQFRSVQEGSGRRISRRNSMPIRDPCRVVDWNDSFAPGARDMSAKDDGGPPFGSQLCKSSRLVLVCSMVLSMSAAERRPGGIVEPAQELVHKKAFAGQERSNGPLISISRSNGSLDNPSSYPFFSCDCAITSNHKTLRRALQNSGPYPLPFTAKWVLADLQEIAGSA